jgi:hypothetical protein
MPGTDLGRLAGVLVVVASKHLDQVQQAAVQHLLVSLHKCALAHGTAAVQSNSISQSNGHSQHQLPYHGLPMHMFTTST